MSRDASVAPQGPRFRMFTGKENRPLRGVLLEIPLLQGIFVAHVLSAGVFDVFAKFVGIIKRCAFYVLRTLLCNFRIMNSERLAGLMFAAGIDECGCCWNMPSGLMCLMCLRRTVRAPSLVLQNLQCFGQFSAPGDSRISVDTMREHNAAPKQGRKTQHSAEKCPPVLHFGQLNNVIKEGVSSTDEYWCKTQVLCDKILKADQAPDMQDVIAFIDATLEVHSGLVRKKLIARLQKILNATDLETKIE